MNLGIFDINSIQHRIAATAALYIVIFAFGFMLTRFGSTYSTVLLTVHKLASIAAVYLLYRSFTVVHQASGLSTLAIVLGVLTGLTFLGLIATGGMISIGGNIPELVYTVHHMMPYLNLLAASASLYILYNIQ